MVTNWISIALLLLIATNDRPVNELPAGWYDGGSYPGHYVLGIDNETAKAGKRSAYIESKIGVKDGFGALMQVFPASQYLGRTIKLSGYIKTEDVSDCAALWLRIDGNKFNDEAIEPVTFKNTCENAMTGTNDWQEIELELYVPIRSKLINFGALMAGTGKIWCDDFKIELSSKQDTNMLDPNLQYEPKNLGFEQ